MNEYEDIFAVRGSRYDKAMRSQPKAREEEFKQIISRAYLKSGEYVADVPAGGGYLQAFLPADCEYWGHEPCKTFTVHGDIPDKENELLPLPWKNQSVDVVMSLAGLHHFEDKRPFFSETYRVLKSSGRFVISDVSTDSPQARFLDEYVGNNNSTGHKGIYLDDTTLEDLEEENWRIQKKEQVNFYWNFQSEDEMAIFCNALFDIVKADKKKTIAAINEYLSAVTFPDDSIGMQWSLMTIVSQKNQKE
ncbi:MAG: methyltransferase domain-containing protein [Methylococcales bacterium]